MFTQNTHLFIFFQKHGIALYETLKFILLLHMYSSTNEKKKQESNMYFDNNTGIYPDPLFNR